MTSTAATSPIRHAPGDSAWWRVGRAGARLTWGASATVFTVGIMLWAREEAASVASWALPEPWTAAGLSSAAAELGLPLATVSAYFALLEFLPATAGLVAAGLVLRGATSWFHLYVATALALFGTLNGAVPHVYDAVLGGTLGEGLRVVQGVAWVAMFSLAYLFPDGRFVPRWARWCALAWCVVLPYFAALDLLALGDPDGLATIVPVLVLWATAACAVVARYRRTTAEQRRQLRGVMAALVLWVAFNLIYLLTPLHSLAEEVSPEGLVAAGLSSLVSYGIVALLPAAIAIAVLKYRLYDVDLWVNRALVYGVLSGIVVLVYALTAALAGLAWQDDDLGGSLIAVLVVAIALHPLRIRVQRIVDRFVYGRRRERYAVLQELGQQLAATLPAEQILHILVRQVGTTLKVPHVEARHGSWSVTHPLHGSPPPGTQTSFPISWQDRELGRLTVVTAPGDDLSAGDRDLLDGLARQAGSAVRAAALTADLRRSRERILVAREDERKRLQHDLHDGLGPTLASLYQRVDAARQLMDSDPAAAAFLLDDVRDQTRSVIGEIRDLVRALRPPELDELGLTAAIGAAANRFDTLSVQVTSLLGPDPLPPVVEVAAYRIAMEALTNVVRHAHATTAAVRLALEGEALAVLVRDNGRGIEPGATPGTGLRSMSERADELGGTCVVHGLPHGGTEVRAVLPLGLST